MCDLFVWFQIYPQERHGIRKPDASEHYETMVLSWLQQNLWLTLNLHHLHFGRKGKTMMCFTTTTSLLLAVLICTALFLATKVYSTRGYYKSCLCVIHFTLLCHSTLYTVLGFMTGIQSVPKFCPTMKWAYLHNNTKWTMKFNKLL